MPDCRPDHDCLSSGEEAGCKAVRQAFLPRPAPNPGLHSAIGPQYGLVAEDRPSPGV